MNSNIDIGKYILDYARDFHQEPLVFLDKNGDIIWSNKVAVELGASVGMNCKELLGDEFDIEKVCAGKKSKFEILVKNPKFAKDIPAEFIIWIDPQFDRNEFAGALLNCKYSPSLDLKINKLLLNSLSSLSFLIVITDKNENIIYKNSVANLYFSQLNCEPKNLTEILHLLKCSEQFIDKIREKLDENGFFSFRLESVRIEGRYFEHNLLKLFDDDKKHIGYLITSFDITEHLKVSERKQQILKQEFLERFSSKVFHKLNNQFLLVMADAGLIRRKLPKNARVKVQDHLTELEDHLLEASETVQLLSLFVRSPKQQYESIDIVEFLESHIKNIMESLSGSVELSVELPDYNVIINGYPSLLDKIFEAIFDNAIRSLSDKGGRIMVSGELIHPDEFFLINYPELSNVPYFKISIADTGIGIDEKKMSKIFEPFFSAWETKSRGLGLSMAMSAIRHHGGTIDIRSTVGVGTTVSLFFPIQSAENTVQKISQDKGENNVVLIIDDDDYVRKALARMLKSLGYVPVSASSGNEGIDLFGKVSPDVVMLDMIMPDIPGEKVFEKLKQINPDCPIIIATAYAQIESVEELIDNGVEYILQKPFTINRLSEVLEKILKNKN